MQARGSLITRDGILQPAPAPRFSATPTELGGRPPVPGEHTEEVLRTWGIRR
jgi:alpha-methylacyl-CoA racemase